jgi:GNAT superfamily N-acetyltransferase
VSQPHAAPHLVDPSRPDQVARVVDILVEAFYDDPLWGWAFPDPQRRREGHRRLWGLFVDGALRFPTVWLNDGASAGSVWLPPGENELSDEQAATFEPMIIEVLGDGASRVFDAADALDQAHPHDEPHYYLSLLGTDPAQRGHGHGLRLMGDNLRRIDEEHLPAYLEASAPVNVDLYRRHGFEPRSTFRVSGDGPEVTTMWREAR